MWWTKKQKELLDISANHANIIVYDSETINNSINSIKSQAAFSKIFYAMKANFNPELLKLISKHNIGFECVSPGEVNLLKKVLPKISSEEILFTPNFAPKDDYIWALKNNLLITLDNLYLLEAWPQIFRGKKILVRIDPGKGEGHHDFVKTAGNISKFGIPVNKINKLKEYIGKYNIEVIGLHVHN
ncbi:MAG: bifunctional aspartate kinase/diaminopimelate decarboxylase, partial [Pseudomonadota bacterium]|nr:bifunctional aspartate kinase/diaminopimelate decarboxylase [Pseudomonadota bacterium]